MAPKDVPQMFLVISIMLLKVESCDQFGPLQATVLTMFSPFLKNYYLIGKSSLP